MCHEALVFTLLLVYSSQINCNEPIVRTSSGDVRGVTLNALGNEIQAFLGIPYAIPPIGPLRFGKPLPVNPWQGIYNASNKGPSCPQYIPKLELPWVPQSNIKEDCLYLNLWVPLEPREGKAVIIWIHGGGFFQGSSVLDMYDGQILASEGSIIVASMNYRLGAFGFLYAGTEEAPGNVGLHDQLLAIHWIKDNIKSFGGDPSLITISGQSAGAISACFHLLSPLARGLATRIILESGSAYNNMLAFPPLISKVITSIFAERVGCNGNIRTPKRYLDCLRSKSAEEIYNEEIKLRNEAFVVFVPRFGDDFLPYHPVAMLDGRKFQPVDVLVGNNADEGSLFVAWRNWTLFSVDRPGTTKSDAERYIRDLLLYPFDVPNDIVIERYIGEIPENDSASLLEAAYRTIGANLIVCPSIFISEIYSAYGNVYYYYFTHRPSQPWRLLREWMGVPHLQEIPFVFGDPLKEQSNYLREEVVFSKDIIKAWSSFAKYGAPYYAPLFGRWPRFSLWNSSYVELNPYRVTIRNNLRKEECDFWRGTT